MKRIEAIVRPHKFDAVEKRLSEMGISGLTVEAVRGFGRQKGRPEAYHETGGVIDFVPKVRLTLVIEDEYVPRLVEAIRQAAFTGEVGDGKIFVIPMGDAVRVRTGESGGGAI